MRVQFLDSAKAVTVNRIDGLVNSKLDAGLKQFQSIMKRMMRRGPLNAVRIWRMNKTADCTRTECERAHEEDIFALKDAAQQAMALHVRKIEELQQQQAASEVERNQTIDALRQELKRYKDVVGELEAKAKDETALRAAAEQAKHQSDALVLSAAAKKEADEVSYMQVAYIIIVIIMQLYLRCYKRRRWQRRQQQRQLRRRRGRPSWTVIL